MFRITIFINKLTCPIIILIPALDKHSVINHRFQLDVCSSFMNHVLNKRSRLIPFIFIAILTKILTITGRISMQSFDFYTFG